MSPTSEIMAEVSLAHSYPELFRVTGPPSSLVVRAEDMWQRYNQCLESVCVYYCRTYYKAVRGGGRRRVDDMCYDRRRAEACVDESAHHALANAGGREIVGKKEGEQKGSARGSVHWGCYYATALDIEVDPQRCGLGSCQSDFALQAVVECRALEPECFRVDILR